MNVSESFNLFEHLYKAENDMLISYKGPFSQSVLNIIGTYIKVILGRNPKQSQKIYRIFVELAQNVSYYSAHKDRLTDSGDGIGSVAIVEAEEAFYFISGNAVYKRDLTDLLDKCEKINSLDPEGLRDYKRSQLELPDGQRGGANIGLIQVALTASNPLNFKTSYIDDEKSFFSVAVKIDK